MMMSLLPVRSGFHRDDIDQRAEQLSIGATPGFNVSDRLLIVARYREHHTVDAACAAIRGIQRSTLRCQMLSGRAI
jgi:hypothetical protein